MATYKGVVPSTKYSFNATLGQITFDSDYTGIALSDIMLITNVKSGTAVTIYDPFDPAKGGILAGLILTLTYSTAGMLNSDPLQIIVGMTSLPTALPTGASTESTLSTLNTKVPSGLTVTSTRLLVDGSGVTQPVSGTVTANAGTGTMDVSVQNASLAVTGTFYQATQPVSGTVTANISGSISNTSFIATQSTATNLKTQAESYQGGSAVSSSNPLYVTVAASATGGDTVYHLVSAASTNPVNIKASAGKVTGWYIYNSNASPRKVAFHNTAGTPTAGTSVYYSLVIPASSGANVSFPSGLNFSTGIAITTVTGLTDADATAVAASDLIINIFYK
jgi:hypothetical protein